MNIFVFLSNFQVIKRYIEYKRKFPIFPFSLTCKTNTNTYTHESTLFINTHLIWYVSFCAFKYIYKRERKESQELLDCFAVSRKGVCGRDSTALFEHIMFEMLFRNPSWNCNKERCSAWRPLCVCSAVEGHLEISGWKDVWYKGWEDF